VAPRLDSWHGVVARLQANKLSAIRLELETTRAGKPLRSAQGVSSPENKPLAQYSRHYVRPDVRPSEHKLFGANSRNWRKYIGAPEAAALSGTTTVGGLAFAVRCETPPTF
jgi:hypothetical protein